MAKTTKDIIITEKNRPLWQSIIAFVSYGIMFFFIGLMLYGFYKYEGKQEFKAFTSTFNCAVFMFIVGLRFSVVTIVCFDMKLSRYKKEYRVGPVKAGQWRQLPTIEYVSVFRQAVTLPGEDDGHVYNVNVWYGHNRHFTIYTKDDGKAAYDMALYISSRLKIDMLDATNPLSKIWITPWVETESGGLPYAKVNKRGLGR